MMRVLSFALMASIFVLGCGSAPMKQGATLAEKSAKKAADDTAQYAKNCTALHLQFQAQVKSGKYLPATLRVHSWAGTAGPKAGGTLSEVELVAHLHGASPQVMLVMARGGLGKSTLSQVLEAQTCGKRATVRLDLKWDVPAAAAGAGPALAQDTTAKDTTPKNTAAKDTPVNPLFALIEAKLRGKATGAASDAKTIEAALHGRDLLLLFDSLDEVSLDRRAQLVAWIQEVLGPVQGTTAVVFTRPPVYSANYGFAHVNARIEIPMFDCAATQRALRELVGDDTRLTNFLEFTKRHGLDRMVVRSEGRCWYPHMATYRDILVLRQIADNTANAPPKVGALVPSRAKVYSFLVTVSLIKDLSGLTMMPRDLMGLVDRMVAAHHPNGQQRNLGFTIGGCLAQTTVADETKRKQVCERLMQSSLFKETKRADTWQFRNQSFADLFLARWMHAEMGKDGAKQPDCSAIATHARLFESNEVAGFLVGMPHGQRCLLPVIQQLCSHAPDETASVELLDQGLPPDQARVPSLRHAYDVAGEVAEGDTCLARTLAALKKTTPAGSQIGAVDKAVAKSKETAKTKRKSKKTMKPNKIKSRRKR